MRVENNVAKTMVLHNSQQQFFPQIGFKIVPNLMLLRQLVLQHSQTHVSKIIGFATFPHIMALEPLVVQ